MDVIINNATPAQVVPQTYTPTQLVPQGYQGYGPGAHHDGGPGFLPLLLVIGAVVFFRQRHLMNRRWGLAGHGPMGGEVRDTFRRGRERFFADGALEIARERYAKGEIKTDEYEALRRTLAGEPTESPRTEDRPSGTTARDGDLKL
ncbi:SHOCT domain-containing protein [Deinococcus hohokamensis]|uniref:SHOCT domain-containing protein n=1 Tax=Deinococcus hohokamensis TaxID=309883 RepID=A0ABV9I6I9_9DEIO